MAKNYTYTQAQKELNTIIMELQNEEVTIDVLPQKIEKATALVELCYKKLKGTEEEIEQAIKRLESIN